MNEQKMPTVTIVTPAYNQAEFLRDTIESVLSQDYPNIDYIVLDDGSTDETPNILAEYGDRFRWETHTNMGQTATINKGWSMAKGEIVTWLNSDDTYLPGAVSKAVDFLVKNPDVGIVYGDTVTTEADGTPFGRSKPLPPFDYHAFIGNWENTIVQPSSFIRKSVIEKVDHLDPKFYYFMDWDLWLRAGLHFKIAYIPEMLSTYRFHAESKTVAQAKKAAPELEYMFERFYSRTDLSPEVLALKKKARMNMYFLTAGYYLRGDDRASARAMAMKALKANPLGGFSLSNLRRYAHVSLR